MIHNINSPRSLRKREQKRELIIQTALELILEAGLAGFTMHKLAEKMDYAVGALYRYFKSKDTLLAAMQRQILSEFSQCFIQTDLLCKEQYQDFSQKELALQRIWLAVEIYLNLKKQAPSKFYLLHEMIVSPQEILSLQEGLLVMKEALPLLRHLQELLTFATETKAFREGNANQRSLLLWSSVQGLLPLEKLGRFVPGYPFESLQTALLETLFSAWGASESSLKKVKIENQKFIKSIGFLSQFSTLSEGAS
ncbi:hypothetical protein COW36_09765 [bacterium (Candidatus Blackallbacteria) CG17_big_fil_post_rev_8_21_14_2_50_48_46]|uniref:HTH tetR-type domain-containing protein n=1 Tax=bacterium (Candidatus Blackallbacteria) CG17_big_fil_post_rev_8_21_14_2_50_48_46 TaxID=2014261 RepID=A0A2M7G5N6_9BACT|nr:MAG: hypothetical protein COW64_01645 [bacterium (Candidatus Blackallbacteria) CG18_big_fil_WC_8_21_14_2_50_49_26]PIW17246.1 MAG: hypothetical protein COW36_09765 [bacterium (Candidatus Blackallbacteria) CG17_big_fil_post_rev_8_21_14_2_50_48_46]PIW51038.1 MAG: hypothetical protein COW20_00775 [bacterium (Candidatus Blackallbacteria) CG13_big_fil_rev_8_21_14_2_50_49_14]